MKNFIRAFIVLLAPFAGIDAQQTITFDDVAPYSLIDNQGFPSIGVPYQGMHWRRGQVVNGTERGYGYANGIVSGSNVLQGYGHESTTRFISSSPFTLNSAWFTSAYKNGASMYVKGYARPHDPSASYYDVDFPYHQQGWATHFASFTIGALAPTFQEFNWTGLYTVTFSSAIGTAAFPDDYGPGRHGYFAVDDVVITNVVATPEPASVTLLMTGLLAGFVIRRRQRRAS